MVTKRLDVFTQGTLNKSRPVTKIIPNNFALHQNFPNPFNPLTHITVELPEEAKVELSVYTINGKKVQTLLKGHQSAGIYEVVFDGSHLASGVYIYRLTTDRGFAQSKKMMLIK
ncbi:T9SS type A sorting domain-containing protein [Calditrichota bacterium GD2]